MSKPFMFHFTAKLYTIFYSRNFFRNFFLKKAKKISPLLSTGNCKIINLSEENILWGFKI